MINNNIKTKLIITEAQYKRLVNEVSRINDEIDLFHGTVHDFEEFKLNNIGGGEGNQTFGWGLYFTNLEDVADDYRKRISKEHNHELWLEDTTIKHKIHQYDELLDSDTLPHSRYIQIRDRVEFLRILDDTLDYNKALKSLESTPLADSNRRWADKHVKPYVTDDLGLIYSVTLHKGKTPDQYDYLLWSEQVPDNQLVKIGSQDTHIRNVLSSWEEGVVKPDSSQSTDLTGSDLYHYLSSFFGSDKEASLYLLKCGIDGIKFPTNTLGSTKYETNGFNYVVFDDKSVTINKKYINRM